MESKRRLGIRFWWDVAQFTASGVVLLLAIVFGLGLVVTEGLPWLGGGLADLMAGELNFVSLLVLVLLLVAFVTLVSGLFGFGAEIGRRLARRLLERR